ncbi:MAG: bacteriohemerythrin [Rhodospirillaceae bacterium]
MHSIKWTQKLDINIGFLNDQHRTLMDLTNTLRDAVSEGQAVAEVGAIFSRLIEETERHFHEEEIYMRRYKYPHIIKHKNLHTNILDIVRNLKRRFDESPGVLTPVNLELLDHWTNHISEHDHDFAVYMTLISQYV